MPFPPEDNNICSSCGTEFGYDDVRKTYDQIRREWISAGARWFSSYAPRPLGWNPWMQMIEAGLAYALPFQAEVHLQQPNVSRGKFIAPRPDAIYEIQLT